MLGVYRERERGGERETKGENLIRMRQFD